MILTSRRLQYARGYIELGMVNEASDELEAIDWDDRTKPEVLAEWWCEDPAYSISPALHLPYLPD